MIHAKEIFFIILISLFLAFGYFAVTGFLGIGTDTTETTAAATEAVLRLMMHAVSPAV